MNYLEALDYMQNLAKFGFNFGLGRICELMRRLNNPHEKLSFIHVGGTNGKGSTVSMISSILQEAGFKVGLFTSPHLHSYTERYRINGVEIAANDVAEILSDLRPYLDAMVAEGYEQPTEFEVGTALAILYFYRQEVDFAVIEVGLGGAIDSTNIITPLVSVITNVAMDHMDYLGGTVEEIARVKAGIIKTGRPVITASDNPVVLEIISQTARAKGSSLVEVGRDWTWRIVEKSLHGQSFYLHGGVFPGHEKEEEIGPLKTKLLGSHQVVNAATAVAAVKALEGLGYSIGERAIAGGVEKTAWPARIELLGGEPPVVIDSAHNYDGAISLTKALEEYFPGRRLVLVLGMLGDKEREKVVSLLAPLARAVVVTKPNSPRAGEWAEMASIAANFAETVETVEDIPAAVDRAREMALPGELVCVTGSIYMVAEAREYLLGR